MKTKQSTKVDIRLLDEETLHAAFAEMGQPAFRARQVYKWLWQKGCQDLDQMTDLSLDLREALKKKFTILPLITDEVQISSDRTIKCRFKLHDGPLIEGVLIPAKERMTACVSSQVGCSLSCKFCATGKMKRIRNITAAEILDQVVMLNRLAIKHFNKHLTNIVYMGMGEPLLNFREVMRSTELISSPKGLGMSPSRLTVSTAGVAKMIHKLGEQKVKFNLAISLHAANDVKRNRIMPINEQNNLPVLKEALQYYYAQTGNRLYYEYILFDNFNDGHEDAKELAAFCKAVPCKVNIIEYNPVDGTGMRKAKEGALETFQKWLSELGVIATYRRSRGKDIDAACGQLANKG